MDILNIDARLMALPNKKPAVTETGNVYNNTTQHRGFLAGTVMTLLGKSQQELKSR